MLYAQVKVYRGKFLGFAQIPVDCLPHQLKDRLEAKFLGTPFTYKLSFYCTKPYGHTKSLEYIKKFNDVI